MLLSFYFPNIHAIIEFLGLPGGSDSKESTCLVKTRIQSLGRKISWRRAWQPTLTLFPGESPWTEEPGRLHSPWGHKELDMT